MFARQSLFHGLLKRPHALRSIPRISTTPEDCTDPQPHRPCLQLRQHDSLLILVLPFAVSIADFADLIGLEKKNLAKPLVSVDARWERCRIRYLECHKSLPF